MVKCPVSDPLLPPSPTFCLRDFESKHGGRVFTGEIVAGTRQFMAFAYADVEIALCVPGRSHHYQQVVARTPSLTAFGEIVVVDKVNQYRRHGKTGNPEKSFWRSTERVTRLPRFVRTRLALFWENFPPRVSRIASFSVLASMYGYGLRAFLAVGPPEP